MKKIILTPIFTLLFLTACKKTTTSNTTTPISSNKFGCNCQIVTTHSMDGKPLTQSSNIKVDTTIVYYPILSNGESLTLCSANNVTTSHIIRVATALQPYIYN